MAENGRNGEAGAGEPDSSSPLWRVLKRLFAPDADQSLRAQIEGVINEHEGHREGGSTGDLSPVERQMLRNLLHFSENDADDVAIPRGEIIAIPASASWAEVIGTFAEHGHSRMPVYGESLDEIKGMIHLKDVFPILARGDAPPADWTALMRQPLYVPQSRGALDVLADMRARRVHLAVVIDEYSGVDGIITIEDLVEEIVGEIEDEHDDAPEELLIALPDGTWEADARAELGDVAERVDQRLGDMEETVDTLGGLAVSIAEEVPDVGTVLDHDSGWRLEIIEGNERHVSRIKLHPPSEGLENEPE
jgi:magnesium and cobalt transporter